MLEEARERLLKIGDLFGIRRDRHRVREGDVRRTVSNDGAIIPNLVLDAGFLVGNLVAASVVNLAVKSVQGGVFSATGLAVIGTSSWFNMV